MSDYDDVSKMIRLVRNAKFGEMVTHLEDLIDSGVWRDYTTPVGTHFTFGECEFDYFLAAVEVDATTIRWAYLKAAEVEDLTAKQHRLADITGKGAPPPEGARRPWTEVADVYATDKSGAGARIRSWGESGVSLVTAGTRTRAANPAHRAAAEAGLTVVARPKEKVWRVRWSDDKAAAQAVVAKLTEDPDLAREVFNLLNAMRSRTTRSEEHRRSEGQNGSSGGRNDG